MFVEKRDCWYLSHFAQIDTCDKNFFGVEKIFAGFALPGEKILVPLHIGLVYIILLIITMYENYRRYRECRHVFLDEIFAGDTPSLIEVFFLCLFLLKKSCKKCADYLAVWKIRVNTHSHRASRYKIYLKHQRVASSLFSKETPVIPPPHSVIYNMPPPLYREVCHHTLLAVYAGA